MRGAALSCAGALVVLAACSPTASEPAQTPAPVTSAATGSAAALAPADASRSGFVGYDVIRPEVVEEGSFVSDGDEPFVAVLRIRSTTGVPGSTKWAWVSDSPQENGSVDEGDELQVPDGSGDAWFTGDLAVRPLDETQMIGMDSTLTADVMVTVGFVFEADRGSTGEDIRILKSLTEPIVKKVASIVEGTSIPFSVNALVDRDKTTTALKKLVGSAKNIQAPAVTNEMIANLVQRFVQASGDPNDVVGVTTTAFVPVSHELLSTVQSLGISPSTIGLLNDGQGDGNQPWTNYEPWRMPIRIPVIDVNGGYIAGEVWYGLLSDRWVDDWVVVDSSFPWQGHVKYWLRLTAAMR